MKIAISLGLVLALTTSATAGDDMPVPGIIVLPPGLGGIPPLPCPDDPEIAWCVGPVAMDFFEYDDLGDTTAPWRSGETPFTWHPPMERALIFGEPHVWATPATSWIAPDQIVIH